MVPKGKLLIIGGHEDKGSVIGENLSLHTKGEPSSHFEILGMLISKIPRIHHSIVIIASASSIEKEMEKLYIDSYKNVGFTKVHYLKLDTKEEGNDSSSLKIIQNAHAVFFTGGDQHKLMTIVKGTLVLKTIKKKYYADPNFIIGGTSAGAMVMSAIMISSGLVGAALYEGAIKLDKGFGFINNVIIDTHFINRGRFGRLAHAITANPDCLGIGLGENTALMISEGNKAECIGSGMIIMIDGSCMGATNINEVSGTTPIIVENLMVSILAEGSGYLIKERQFFMRLKNVN